MGGVPREDRLAFCPVSLNEVKASASQIIPEFRTGHLMSKVRVNDKKHFLDVPCSSM